MPKINERYRNLIEKELINTQIPKSPIKDEMTVKVKEFMKEYFNLRKTSIDSRLLKILRQNRELTIPENKTDSNNTNDLNIDHMSADNDQIEKTQSKKKSVKFCLGKKD